MKKKFRLSIVTMMVAMVMILGSTVTAFADQAVSTKDSAGNVYFSGQEQVVQDGVMFGGYGAGMNLTVKKVEAEDSIALAGYNITISDSEIGGSEYLAGYTINVSDCDVAGNIMAAGQSIVISDTACNAATITGANISFDGKAKALNISGANVVINGKIDGDVNISGDSVTFGENAEITGKAIVKSADKPEVVKGAKVENLVFDKIVEDKEDAAPQTTAQSIGSALASKIRSALYWSAAMVLIGLLMFAFGRNHLEGANQMIRSRTGEMLGSGAIALIAAPIAIIVCMITFIGIPLGVITGIAYGLILCLAGAFAGASLGILVLKKLPALPAALIGIVVIEIAKQIPYVGAMVTLAAFLFALGYVIQYIYLTKMKKKEEPQNAIEVVAEAEVPQ